MKPTLSIRKAEINDCKAVFEIRSHPEVVKTSLSPVQFDYSAHIRWYESSLINPLRKIFVVEDVSTIVGVVRFDLLSDTEALVSIYVAPSQWGKGIGSLLLSLGEVKLKEECPGVSHIKAEVLVNNLGSLKLFDKNGYYQKMITFYKDL